MAKLTVQMSEELDDALESIASTRGIPKTQALRNAVAMMKYLDTADRDGQQVIIRDAHGNEQRIVFETRLAAS